MTTSPHVHDPQFQRELQAESDRFSATVPPVKISRYNPHLTSRWDDRRRTKINLHMREWSRAWWLARGFRMTVLDANESTISLEPIATIAHPATKSE
jgi:hypothetical protein